MGFETVDLFKSPLTAGELGRLLKAAGLKPRDVMRTKDPAYDELGLGSGRHSDAQLLAVMAAHPGLIQRPIALRRGRAVVARPVERLGELLD